MDITTPKLLAITLFCSLIINLVLFLIAFRLKSDKLTDISYALSFMVINIVSLVYAVSLNSFSLLVFFMVAIWGIRLGCFLFIRVMSVGKDRRFDDIRNSFFRFGSFWLGQAVTAWVLMWPVTLSLQNNHSLSAISYMGIVIWLIALVIETAADYQKFIFKQDRKNKGKWIQSGVWKYSRHPNYFGEIMIWVGIYLTCLPALDGIEKLFGLLSPLLISYVLLRISGVPILEQSADKRWGDQKEYQKYKENSRLLVPLPK